MVTAPHRTIERVPALLVGLLNEVGKLPHVDPPEVLFGRRDPGIAEADAMTWLVMWEGHALDEHGFRRAVGVLAHRHTYDFHTASDVDEITYLAGTRRAVIELVRHVDAAAKFANRRLIGAIDVGNVAMASVLEALGYKRTRYVYEAR
jgi:hypothetical protein